MDETGKQQIAIWDDRMGQTGAPKGAWNRGAGSSSSSSKITGSGSSCSFSGSSSSGGSNSTGVGINAECSFGTYAANNPATVTTSSSSSQDAGWSSTAGRSNQQQQQQQHQIQQQGGSGEGERELPDHLLFQQSVLSSGGILNVRYGGEQYQSRIQELWAALPGPGEYVVKVRPYMPAY